MEGSIGTRGGLCATSSISSSGLRCGAAHPPGGLRLERWPQLWRGPVVSPRRVTLRVSDPPGRPAVSGVARPALPPRLSGQGRPLFAPGGGAGVKAPRTSPTPCGHAPRRGRGWRSSSLQLPNRRLAGLGARLWEWGLSWRRRGKQVKRERRGG